MMLSMSDRLVDAAGKIGGKRPPTALVFQPPREAKLTGDKGEALVRWVKQPDGQLMIVSVNGQPLGEQKEKPEPTEPEGDEPDGDEAPASADPEAEDDSTPMFGGG
jgi:hypothetical protein